MVELLGKENKSFVEESLLSDFHELYICLVHYNRGFCQWIVMIIIEQILKRHQAPVNTSFDFYGTWTMRMT